MFTRGDTTTRYDRHLAMRWSLSQNIVSPSRHGSEREVQRSINWFESVKPTQTNSCVI